MKNLVLTTLLTLLTFSSAFAGEKAKESTYDRVMRTGTIRCAYILLPPEFNKDVNTGAFSGLAYDIATEVAKRLNLKIDWVEETGFQTMVAGLQTGRYDSVCFSLYRRTEQAAVADFSTPLFYSGTGVFVRADDHRFDGNLAAINDSSVTISTIDGEMAQFIASEDYPKAKTLSMPQFTDLSQMMLNVETKKADVAFVNELVAEAYQKSHPGKLINIAVNNPIRLFSHGFMFPKGEYDFVRMMNLSIEEMHDQGVIEKLINKYDQAGKTYLRVAQPYLEKK